MKGLKRICAVLMCLMMVIQLVGCGKKNNETGSFAGGATGDYVISEEPVELKIFYNSSKEEDGQWNTFKEAAKMTNVMGTVTIPKSNSDIGQAFNIMMASNDMPDIVETYDVAQFVKFGMEGAFEPLNKHLDKMPNFKKMLEDEEIRKGVTAADGNIYMIPFMPGGDASAGWFIRTDWLKKLGLEIPKTTDELYKVYTAFKNDDPNGNGAADEIPYYGQKTLEELFPLWYSRASWYVEDGKMHFGPYEEEYKTAIENIIKWYKEGLIDREIFTRNSTDREKLLADNLLGSGASGWFGSTSAFNDKFKDTIEGFEFKPIAPINGIALYRRPKTSSYGWGVSASSKNIDVAVKYLDFWLSDAGHRLMNFGVEGVHYDLVDGKPVFKEEHMKNPDFKKELTEFGVMMDIGFKQDFEYERQWINDIAVEGMKLYESNDWYVEQLPNIGMYIDSKDVDRHNKLTTQIETYTTEKLQKWIMGAEVFDDAAFDKFIAQLEKYEIKELLKIKQKGLDTYNGKN